MFAQCPGEIVGELISLFDPLNIGVGFAPEETKAWNIHGGICACRNLRVIEVRKAAARELEAELVHLAAAYRPGVLHHTGHVAISLFGGSRIGILSEGLILAAALQPGDCAGTYIDAKGQPVVCIDVMVEPQ